MMNKTFRIWWRAALCLPLLFFAGTDPVVSGEATTTMMRAAVEQMRKAGGLEVGEASLAAVPLLTELYERRDYRPAWTSRARVDELLELLAASEEEGLDPQDYNLPILIELRKQLDGDADPDPAVRVGFDLLLSDSLARLAYHMRYGKVVPERLDGNWNFGRKAMHTDVVQRVQDAIDSDSLATVLRGLAPRQPYYENLKQLLAEHRAIAASGGWPTIPDGATMGRGDRGKRVRVLRERLGLSSGNIFDAEVEQSVRVFQKQHALEIDGRVGKNTLRQMNVSVEPRIDQIRVNLERARWVFRDFGEADEFVVVNIAGFRVLYVRDGKPAWIGRAQVGKTYRKTPVFRGEIEYLVLNPTWTVPPTVLSKDVLPAARKDIGYLDRKNMSVLDGSGRVVDPTTIEWNRYSNGGFPYTIRQDPGPNNALGRIKFIFPNPHFVFLHDTPSRALFDRAKRAFSSGCIRVENPFELAEILLDDPKRTREIMLEQVGGQTERINLDEPVTVMILYLTAGSIRNEVKFRDDIYGRDPRVLKALEDEFEFVPPSGLSISWPMDG